MDKQTWDEWIAEHGRQVVEYVMVCLEDAKELWDRAIKAEKERDEALERIGDLKSKLYAATQYVANLRADRDEAQEERDAVQEELTKVKKAVEAREQDNGLLATVTDQKNACIAQANARIAELEEAQVKDRESYASTKLHNIALRDELIALKTPRGEQPKLCLEITDEMVEMAAEAMRMRLIEPVAPLWKEIDPATRRYWIKLARAALEAAKDHLVGACPECESKVKRIAELGIDALAMGTEMSQAATRIKALEAVLRETLMWCECGARKVSESRIQELMTKHSITLPDPEGGTPATMEPYPGEIDAHMEEEHARSQQPVGGEIWENLRKKIAGQIWNHSGDAMTAASKILDLVKTTQPEPVGDEGLREKIDSKLHTLLPHAARATVCIITDEILSIIGPRLTPEIQARLAYLEREHRKFCEIFNEYAEEEVVEEFQNRLAQGDAAIAVLRNYRKWLNAEGACSIVLNDAMTRHGILDLITEEQDATRSDCPGDCETRGDTAICPQAPVKSVERQPLPEKWPPSVTNISADELADDINALIDCITADRALADEQSSTRNGAA